MKRIFTLILALSLLALTACSGGGTGETDSLTPEERTQRFVTAITDARSEEDNEYNSILSSADDDTADMTFQLLGVTTEDMESFAISVSLMNVKAYGIAVIKPAQDSEDTVKEGLQGFIDQQQQNFQMYLPDQRFELTLKALSPDMAIIAPWREWDIESRDEEIDYAEAHNIPLKINRETNYSKDKNLWHLSHEGLDLEGAPPMSRSTTSPASWSWVFPRSRHRIPRPMLPSTLRRAFPLLWTARRWTVLP